MDFRTGLCGMKKFHIYLSSKGSSNIFPSNKNSSFVNVLESPLTGMTNYEVALCGSFLTSPLNEGTLCHVLSNIVQPSPCDDRKMPLLGLIATKNMWMPKPIHVPVLEDTITSISVSLTDGKAEALQLSGDVHLILSFKRKV